jgi:hypothetical protein
MPAKKLSLAACMLLMHLRKSMDYWTAEDLVWKYSQAYGLKSELCTALNSAIVELVNTGSIMPRIRVDEDTDTYETYFMVTK